MKAQKLEGGKTIVCMNMPLSMKNRSVATSYDDLTISSVTFLSMQPFSTRNYMYYSFLTV